MNTSALLRLPTASRLLGAFAERVRRQRRLRQDRSQLQAMDARELSDLGIGRGELAHRLRMPAD